MVGEGVKLRGQGGGGGSEGRSASFERYRERGACFRLGSRGGYDMRLREAPIGYPKRLLGRVEMLSLECWSGRDGCCPEEL